MTTIELPTRRQYWDSCLLINYLSNLEKDKADIVDELLVMAERGKPPTGITIVISTLVMAEVGSKPENMANRQERVERLFSTDWPYLEIRAVTGTIARRARDIRLTYPELTVPDSIHVATALIAGVDVFFTYDGATDKRARRRSGRLLAFSGLIGNPPLRIEAPWVSAGSGSLDALKRQIEQASERTPKN